jgi:hypothetical protein
LRVADRFFFRQDLQDFWVATGLSHFAICDLPIVLSFALLAAWREVSLSHAKVFFRQDLQDLQD